MFILIGNPSASSVVVNTDHILNVEYDSTARRMVVHQANDRDLVLTNIEPELWEKVSSILRNDA